MKICLISQEYPPETGGGGIGTQTYLKAHGLTARGHEVHVVSSSVDDKPRTYMDRLAHIHRIPQPFIKVPGYELSTCWLAYSFTAGEKVTELSERIAFDIVQFPEYGAEGFVYLTDTFKNRTAKHVLQCHGPLAMFTESVGWPERGSTFAEVGSYLEGACMKHVDLLLASSRNTAKFCADRYGLDVGAFRVIHSAVNTERFAAKPRAAGPGFPRVLFVGNIAGNKGTDAVVKSVLALRSRFPDIRMVAIGRTEEPFLSNLKERIRAAGAEGCVEIKGHVPYEELPQWYAWCDFFAGPSTFEPGPGNVYLEAMSAGRPVIACDSGGAPEVVLHDKTGLLIPPSDQPALDEAMIRLTEDTTLRARLGGEARAWIESNFTFERYTDKVESLYQELLA
ncbi:MAG: glycosyltransferase family 4 protein [Planctomycetota bacterium]|nr:glycosyltransferase family 4 protein [Planctomycetota bacterium]